MSNAVEEVTDLTVDEQIDTEIRSISGAGRGNVNNQIHMLEVKIYPQHVEVENRGVKKTISLLDFKQVIDGQLKTESKLEAMALPYNTFMFSKSASNIQISCYYPERKLDLKFHARGASKVKTFKACQMPNVIISHALKNDSGKWLITDTKYFATNLKVTELPEDRVVYAFESGLYRMPFPNFYEDGKMCYGGNVPPARHGNNLRGLDYFYQMISDSPFNSDLGINVPEYRENIEGWFTFLGTIDKFDYKKISQRSY